MSSSPEISPGLTQSPTPPKRSGPPTRLLVLLIIILPLAGVLILSAIVLHGAHASSSWISRVYSAVTGRTLAIDTSQPTVVNRIQRLSRLETVVYAMDKIVSGSKENPILPDFLAGDRLLMLVHGEVVAGIDFETLKPDDVHISGREIRIHLPAAQVFSTRLDSDKTRVYSRQTGLLVPTDPDLETQVRQESERQLEQSALADGILRTAQQNAASTVTSLLQGLGFEKITIE
jgi:hypothetical protein